MGGMWLYRARGEERARGDRVLVVTRTVTGGSLLELSETGATTGANPVGRNRGTPFWLKTKRLSAVQPDTFTVVSQTHHRPFDSHPSWRSRTFDVRSETTTPLITSYLRLLPYLRGGTTALSDHLLQVVRLILLHPSTLTSRKHRIHRFMPCDFPTGGSELP